MSFGGGGGVVRSADVIEGERGPPRLGQRRQLDLVPHVLVVGVEGVGTLVAGPHEVWSESSNEV